MFSFNKTCPKCNKQFNVFDVKMSRMTTCPNCKTPIMATLSNTLFSGIFLVFGLGISELISIVSPISFYIPMIIFVAITIFIIEPSTVKYKIKK